MRQFVGAKKLAQYRNRTGLPVIKASVRGGTEHRINLYLEDGSIMHWWPKQNNEMELSCVRWKNDSATDRLNSPHPCYVVCDGPSLRLLLGHADFSVLRRYLALDDADIAEAHRNAPPTGLL